MVWQGNPDNTSDRYRSIPLAHFETLARIDGIRLLSLQVGPGTEQLATIGFPVTDLGKRFDRSSLSDLAAVLMNVDLVISVETAPAHLWGPGRARLILLLLKPDWALAALNVRLAPGIPRCVYFGKPGPALNMYWPPAIRN